MWNVVPIDTFQERKQQRRQLRAWHQERGRYGKTASGAYVHMESLDRLCQLGYERALAAEALRAADNEEGAALDVLCDAVRRSALQLGLVAAQIREAQEGPQEVSEQVLVCVVYREWGCVYVCSEPLRACMCVSCHVA